MLFKKNKKRAKKKFTKKKAIIILAIFTIFAGIFISVYPYILTAIFNYRQQSLMNTWILEQAGIGPSRINESLSAATDENAPFLINDNYEEDINAFFDFSHALRAMVGTLNIPSINLTSPILNPETEQNLNIGVCEVAGSTAAPGEIGNYILAGHYSRIRGRHFNRLPEIQIGASIFISNRYGIFEYEVYEILQVRAQDTWAVRLDVQERIATLVTCDYSVQPFGRIVVKCRLR